MRPGVCTAPEPAPERDRPSEGCQLAALEKHNYVMHKRQARRSTKASRGGVNSTHLGARRRVATSSCYVVVLRRRVTSSCYVVVLRPCAASLLDAFWFLLPPPHARKGTGARPYLVQRLAFIQPPVLHHVPDLLRVVD